MAAEKITLTTGYLKSLKAPDQMHEIRDAGCIGLRVRIYPSGKIVFRWLAKAPNGKNIVKTLGNFPSLSLAKARSLLDDLKQKHSDALETGDSLQQADKTVEELAVEYLDRRIMKQLRTADEVVALLDNLVLPVMGKRKLRQVNTVMCRKLVEEIVDRGHPARARVVLARIKHMLDFAVSRGDMEVNPASPLKAEALGIVRKIGSRVLSPIEIYQFFSEVDRHQRLSLQVKLALKILMLTGVRTGELLKAKWENVDFDKETWTIPISDQKMKKSSEHRAKPFVVPLVPQTMELFIEAHRLAEGAPFVMASHSKTGRLEDKVLGHAVRRMFEPSICDEKSGEKVPRLSMPRFTPHDLRRTMRTELGKLRVAPHLAERCLNHSIGQIVDTYDHGDYIEERREALALWADRFERFLSGDIEEAR